MNRPTWQDLLLCYDNVDFLGEGKGVLTIATSEILQTIHLIEADEIAAGALNFYPTGDIGQVSIGDRIDVHIGAPKLSIGILAKTLDDLLKAPRGFIEFPPRFYVVDGRLSDRDTSATVLKRYHTIVLFVRLLAEAATFLDREEQKLFYFKDGKVELPLWYTWAVISKADTAAIKRLLLQFEDQLHRKQKLDILGDAIAKLVKSQTEPTRFPHLILNIDQLVTSIEVDYRLFVSSFSYDKIRTDIENANLDFVTRIHKTFVDIQGQLLGVPIATIVVASQLKSALTCGAEAWTNLAVLAGAWIFVVFLSVSIANQFLTLNAIAKEVKRQRSRLEGDFAAISSKFIGSFRSLITRIRWYRFLFLVVGTIGIGGAIFATIAFRSLTTVKLDGCVW